MIAVDLVEVCLGLFLMAEHLDDLLSLHHFLDKALRPRDRTLRGKEVPACAAADEFGDKYDGNDADENDQRKIDAEIEHDAQKRQTHDPRNKQLRDRLRDHLAERIDIICVIAHDIAVIVRIEIADGQLLHAIEHLLAHFSQISLRDDRHQLIIDRAGNQ